MPYEIEREGASDEAIATQITELLRWVKHKDADTQHEILSAFTPEERRVAESIAAQDREADGHAETVRDGKHFCRRCGVLTPRMRVIRINPIEVAYHPGHFDDFVSYFPG